MERLHAWGYSAPFEAEARGAPGEPARVIEEQRELYRVVTDSGARAASVTGRLRHEARGREDFPAVGDFVLVEGPAILRVLPRRSVLRRKEASAGSFEAQVIAANVDRVFIATSCNEDFRARRIERYLAMVRESGAAPLVLLTKCDLGADLPTLVARAEAAAPGTPVLAVSAATGAGFEALAARLPPGETAAIVGPSGVGKSTIANRLLGREEQATAGIREDGRGRHTTTARRLLRLPSGALLVDTPGMRELALIEEAPAFPEVEELAAGCRFRDCRHESEPGCAVRDAVDAERIESWRRLEREAAFHARKHDQRLANEERRRWKRISKEAKRHKKR